MYTGTLIEELIATVDRAEETADERAQEEKLAYWYRVAEAELAQFESGLAGVA